MKIKHIAATALMALGLVASPASFASLIATSNFTDSANATANLTNTLWRAQSFTVASDQDYVLSDVQIITSNSVPTTFLRIYADNASTPGALLETLTFESASPTTVTLAVGSTLPGQVLTFSSSGLSLTASNTYWVVAGLTGGVGQNWFATASPSETGLPGWTLGNSLRTSTNAGLTWSSPAPFVFYTTINVVEPQNVPEPSTVALMGIAGISVLRRRKKA